ncbi:MAG: Gfo/Idh/MocA family oxidoreductase [Novosphingobium sp.]|nr:Gfo/Idh/MocA family oxidoreductase [Novosphingobium sp.]
MSTAIPAVVVGTGFGCRIHVPALRATGFEVVGLVGSTPERLARRAEQVGVRSTFTDLAEAIVQTGAKVVTIATPPNTHAGLALTAIERGCHVVCEKPMARNAEEGEAILAAAERAGVIHLMGNEFRWQPDRALIGRAIADGLIGEPRYLTITQFSAFVADPTVRMPPWWFDKSAGGGWLGASGSHLVDQVRAWLGEFESVSAALPLVSDRPRDAAEDSYVLRFAMANGTQGVIQQIAGAWGPMASLWRVTGTTGSVWAENGTVLVADREGVRELPVPDDLRLPEPPPAERPDSSRAFSHIELGPYTRLCEALRARIDGRAPDAAVTLPTFRDGVAAMRVLDAVRASDAAGGELVRIQP